MIDNYATRIHVQAYEDRVKIIEGLVNSGYCVWVTQTDGNYFIEYTDKHMTIGQFIALK